MKEYTLTTKRSTKGDCVVLGVMLYEGPKKEIDMTSDFIESMVKWLVTIDLITKQIELCEYRKFNGVVRLTERKEYVENTFVDWELLDQSIAFPLSLKHRILEELTMH